LWGRSLLCGAQPDRNSSQPTFLKRKHDMRICFLALGTFTHIGAYLDYFKQRGHDVCLVALEAGPERNVPTHNVGLSGRFTRPLGKLSYLPAILRARKVIRSIAPDGVHAHYASSAGLAAYACDYHPWMVTAHGTDVAHGVRSVIWRPLLGTIFRNADCVNAVSDELREMILRLEVPQPKVETFTLGINTNQFEFRGRDSGRLPSPLRLVCTRRLEPVYDHGTMIRAMAILKSQGIKFDLSIIGDGILRGRMEQLTSDLGLTDRITFAGTVPNAGLPGILAQHDVYLSSSTRDGASLCLLEAMSSGLFPIVSDIRANTDWISHGQNGLLHKVSDPDGLARCISGFIANPQVFGTALRSNRTLVLSKGDRETNMKRLEDIYQRLILNAGAARTVPSRSSGVGGTVSALRRN